MDTWALHPRGRLVAISRAYPQLLDAGYSALEKLRTPHSSSSNASTEDQKGQQKSLLRPPMGLEEHGRHRCIVELDGHGYQGSLAAKMLTGAAVISYESEWPLWFQPLLTHGQHLMVVRGEPPTGESLLRGSGAAASPEGVLGAIRWLRANDAAAHAMAARGAARILDLLAPRHLTSYVAGLLWRYKQLFADADEHAAKSFEADIRLVLDAVCSPTRFTERRVCSQYNASAPPPQFAASEAKRRAADRARETGRRPAPSAARLRHEVPLSCPAAGKYGDSPMKRCDSWCSRPEHCSWCKCAGCSFCGPEGGSRSGGGSLMQGRGGRASTAKGPAKVAAAAIARPTIVSAASSSGCTPSELASSSLPMVSLVVATCNRPAFVAAALASASRQDYPGRIEAIIVDDSTSISTADAVEAAVAAAGREGSYSAALPRLSVKHVRLPASTHSIGAKRNVALSHAAGSVFLHWDDDDLHPPSQVRLLACPIVRNRSDLATATFSTLAELSTTGLAFYHYRPHDRRYNGSIPKPFLGTLAYSRATAVSLSPPGGPLAPFAPTSRAEDLHFVERALRSCHRMLPVDSSAGPAPVYTRHHAAEGASPGRGGIQAKGASNTFSSKALRNHLLLEREKRVGPPSFMEDAVQERYVDAERDAAAHGACTPVAGKRPPNDLQYPLLYPYMARRCCRSTAVGAEAGREQNKRRGEDTSPSGTLRQFCPP